MRSILVLLASFGLAQLSIAENVNKPTYQERAVAAVLMGEAWGEGERGMTAVAEVICRRAKLRGTDPLAVITERNRKRGIWAFSCLNGRGVDRLIQRFERQSDFVLALRIARTAVHTPERLPGFSQNATHFTLAREKPYWARGHRPVAVIGNHAFYRLDY